MDAKLGKQVGQYLKARAEADAALDANRRASDAYVDAEAKCTELAIPLQELVTAKQTRRIIRIDDSYALVIDYNGGGGYNIITRERLE